MNDELRARIASDIQKSGFGSEMKALQIIKKAGWTATGSVHYVDLDTGATRESDIEAHHVCAESSNDERNIRFQSFLSLSIEVKKSERPWIVFREIPSYPFQLHGASSELTFTDGLRSTRVGLLHVIGATSLATLNGWYGNGIHEAFKSPDQPSRWYAAFVSVCKAAEHELGGNSWLVDESKPIDHFPYLWFSRPVVVLDGQLISAKLDANDELVLEEEKWCSVKFAYKTASYQRDKYFVDVVTLGALEEFLAHQSRRNEKLATSLQRLANREKP